MLVLVCGSRTLADNPYYRATVARRIDTLPAGEYLRPTIVMHGGAPGPDRWAAQAASRRNLLAREYLPDWERHGKKAGILRNLEMLDQGPDLVIAFWDGESRGTKHTIDGARRRGIPVEVILD